MSLQPANDHEALIARLGTDHRLAHEFIFKTRHPNQTPPFHYEMLDDLHGPVLNLVELAFRGAAKSTRAEEYLAIRGLFGRFENCILVGASYPLACERLGAIMHELDTNENIEIVFGSQRGAVWNENRIVLSNGKLIQAVGRGQAVRGTKYNNYRPDECLLDDIEDEESIGTPEARMKTERWLMRTLIPALTPNARIRVLANMLDTDCLAVRLEKSGSWKVKKYPIEYVGADGTRQATWADRFPLSWIDAKKEQYVRTGMLNEYMQEYMVEAVDPSTRVFTSSMLRVDPQVRTWQPTYAFYDPARTVKDTSAHTGKVVFSWIANRLIVWEGDGQLWMPDQIINDIFKTNEEYGPIHIGVEQDGLNEFLLQPLRAEMTRRSDLIPIKPYKAPVNKRAFIRSLQPFFVSGEITFAKEMPVLSQQLLSFPTGRIDVPNALAYALRMRPGLPIYDNFGAHHVRPIRPSRGSAAYLAVNATRQYTTGVLVQVTNGALHVLGSWCREGDPGLVLAELVAAARLAAGSTLTCYAPKEHWNAYDGIGLRAVASKVPVRLSMGGDTVLGRAELRNRLERTVHNAPALAVSPAAGWVLNAFAGGYARSVPTGKPIEGDADEGIYRTMMEGLEAFAATLAQLSDLDDTPPNYAVDAQGRRYLTAMPRYR